ncbi:hypothetical protein AMBR_LLDLPDMO_02287 [Lactiplantibacillus plantarum]|nr:hypothetical protein AMBR_LLDLPDMO_02287 [Lactiplantibacillus plantarum]
MTTMNITKTMFKKKLFWSILLFLDVVLFIEALSTNSISACIVVMIISEMIYFKGNHILFGEFDTKRHAKREQYKKNCLKKRTLDHSSKSKEIGLK